MKKFKKILVLPLFILLLLAVSGCGRKPEGNVYTQAKESKTIYWGVKADTRLFGLMNIKTGKIEGFEIDLANALTKQILGKDGQAEFVQTTPKTRIPLLKNGNIDAAIATMTITPERKKQVDFSTPYFNAGQSLLVKDDSDIKNIRDLNGKTTVAVKGTTAVANVKKFAPKAQKLPQAQALDTSAALLKFPL